VSAHEFVTINSPTPSPVDEPSLAPAPSRRATLFRRLTLLLILAAAAGLRFYPIGGQSLWADEGLTARILRLPATEMLQRIGDWEQTPPLYYYLLKPYVSIFGQSENVLRYPSALFGTLAVLALYITIRRTFNTAAALTAALLLALAPYHIAYSQEARAYALFILLTILSCDLFLRLLRKPTQNLELLYVVTTAALLYTHLYGIFIVAAQALAYLNSLVTRASSPCERPALPLKRFLTLNLVILILYSPYVRTIYSWIRTVQTGFWVKHVTLDDISRAYETYTGSVPLLIALLSLSVIALWRTRHRAAASMWLGVMFLPVVIPVIVSVLTRPTFSARYGMPASIGLFALAAIGVSKLPNLKFQIPVAVILTAMTLLPTTIPDPKPQWREAAWYLENNMRPGDFAAINRKGAAQAMYDYYVHRKDVRRIGFDAASLPVTQPLAPGQHVWLILYTCDIPANVMIARGNWQVARQKQFREILVLELRDSPESATRPSPTH
jgi:4-amino-4-deoxy-L-arabinose transferase-like glycosyltransferase